MLDALDVSSKITVSLAIAAGAWSVSIARWVGKVETKAEALEHRVEINERAANESIKTNGERLSDLKALYSGLDAKVGFLVEYLGASDRRPTKRP